MATLAELRGQWSSSTRFVVACTVAIIGLGSFWRLPYLLTAYGGGAFLLVYVLAVLVLGLPLLSGQLLLARGTQADIPGVLAQWTRTGLHSRVWTWFGWLAVAGAALLLACYGVIAGWSLAYSARGAADLLDQLDMEQAQMQFAALARDAEKGFGWLLVFIGFVVAAGARGLRNGVEPLMRTLGLLVALGLLLLLIAALRQPQAAAMARALFAPDFSALYWRGILEAFYQAFFTLSIGTGVIVALGSYLPERAAVVRLAWAVLVLNLVASLLVALALVILLGDATILLEQGLGQLFVVIPAVLEPAWLITLFYVLIALLGLAAAIGLFEPVARLLQCRLRITRLRASLYAGVVVWLLGLLGLLSFSLPGLGWHGFNLFDGLLLLATDAILPAIGLMFCVLLGRVLSLQRLRHAWRLSPRRLGRLGFVLWHGSLRYPTRVALVLVLFYSLGGVAVVQWLWGS